MKGMAKIRLFYFGAMALILPQFRNIIHFVFMVVCKGAKIHSVISDAVLAAKHTVLVKKHNMLATKHTVLVVANTLCFVANMSG